MKLGKEGTLALHSVIFGLFMYVGVRFILDPFVKRFLSGQIVEGGDGIAYETGDAGDEEEEEE